MSANDPGQKRLSELETGPRTTCSEFVTGGTELQGTSAEIVCDDTNSRTNSVELMKSRDLVEGETNLQLNSTGISRGDTNLRKNSGESTGAPAKTDSTTEEDDVGLRLFKHLADRTFRGLAVELHERIQAYCKVERIGNESLSQILSEMGDDGKLNSLGRSFAATIGDSSGGIS